MKTARSWIRSVLALAALSLLAGCATGAQRATSSEDEAGVARGGITYSSRVDAIGQMKGASR